MIEREVVEYGRNLEAAEFRDYLVRDEVRAICGATLGYLAWRTFRKSNPIIRTASAVIGSAVGFAIIPSIIAEYLSPKPNQVVHVDNFSYHPALMDPWFDR